VSVPPRADEHFPGAGAAATTGESLLRGGVWSIAVRFVPQLYVLAVSIAAARFLGPEDFGRQSFIAFVELSVIALLTGGLANAIVRHVADSVGRDRTEAVRRLFTWAWRLELAGAAVGGGAVLAVGLLGAEPRSAWIVAGVATSLGVLHAVPNAVLLGIQRWRDASVVGLVTGAAGTLATISVLAAGGGITGMFVVEAVVSAGNLFWTSWLMRRALAATMPVGRLAGEEWVDLRRRATGFALLASYGVILTLVLWRRSEFFFLERYSTETELALYSVVFAVTAALMRFPEALAAVALPAVATLSGAGELDRIRSGFGRGTRLMTIVALPLTAAVLALGPLLLLLIYGEDFRGTGPVLLIMVAIFPLVPLLHLGGSVLSGLGLLRVQLLAETGAAALNIGLAFALVPAHGAVGAAIANVAGQGTAAALVFVYALRVIGPLELRLVSLAPTVVSSAVAGFAAWLAADAVGGAPGLLLGLVAGTLVFGTLSAALRIVPADDAAWLDQAAGPRLGGFVGWVCRRFA
jgi:O-antigen/teichoic acid export membrane protein